jgi:shikimate dehydrogenase
MPLLGLIGFPLAHSFSQEYFRVKFSSLKLLDWEYRMFPIQNISELPDIVDQNSELLALNVTIPHKQSVLPFCDSITEEVKAIGAANLVTINRIKDGKPELKGHNTDHYGFAKSLISWQPGHLQKAVILGDGGASKAVQYALQELKIDFEVLNHHALNHQIVNLTQYDLVVNCTPVGMKKEGINYESELLPLAYQEIHAGQYFYDLVYNPEETAMMKQFALKGAIVKNGIEMLHLQADKAWEIIGKGLGHRN